MSQPEIAVVAVGTFVLIVIAAMATIQVRHFMFRRAEVRLQKTLPIEEVFLEWLRRLQYLHAHIDDNAELGVVILYGDQLASVADLRQFHQWVEYEHRAMLVGLFHDRQTKLDPATYNFLLGYRC